MSCNNAGTAGAGVAAFGNMGSQVAMPGTNQISLSSPFNMMGGRRKKRGKSSKNKSTSRVPDEGTLRLPPENAIL